MEKMVQKYLYSITTIFVPAASQLWVGGHCWSASLAERIIHCFSGTFSSAIVSEFREECLLLLLPSKSIPSFYFHQL